jgi:hypothetical protein
MTISSPARTLTPDQMVPAPMITVAPLATETVPVA